MNQSISQHHREVANWIMPYSGISQRVRELAVNWAAKILMEEFPENLSEKRFSVECGAVSRDTTMQPESTSPVREVNPEQAIDLQTTIVRAIGLISRLRGYVDAAYPENNPGGRPDIPEYESILQKLYDLSSDTQVSSSGKRLPTETVEITPVKDCVLAEDETERTKDRPSTPQVPPCGEASWVSVNDRVPQSNREVLIRCGYRADGPWFTAMGIYAAKHSITSNDQEYDGAEDEDENGDLWWPEGWYNGTPNDETYYAVSHVTHWMKLPDAPSTQPAMPSEKESAQQPQGEKCPKCSGKGMLKISDDALGICLLCKGTGLANPSQGAQPTKERE